MSATPPSTSPAAPGESPAAPRVPRPAPALRRILSHARLETRVLLSNGEQLMVAIALPAMVMVGLWLLPVGRLEGTPAIDTAVAATPRARRPRRRTGSRRVPPRTARRAQSPHAPACPTARFLPIDGPAGRGEG